MIAVIIGRLFHFLVPGGVILLLGVLFGSSGELIHWRPVVAKAMLFLVPGAGLFVSWRFNRFRPVFAILALLVAEGALQNFCRGVDIDRRLAKEVMDLVAVLLPLNLALIAMGREKGVLNIRGLAWLSLIFGQILLTALLFTEYHHLAAWFGRDILAVDISVEMPLAQPGLAAYLISLLLIVVNLFRRQGAVETGFVWALAASYLGVAVYTGLLSTFFLATAGLILVVSVVEAAYSMAYRDELTGLPGRRALNETLGRLRGDYAVAMIDIDFFKKFNDRYGHDVGDQVLKMVAGKISRVKGRGRSFRYGGEEFTVVFPGRHGDQVVFFLEKLRETVEASGFTLRRPGRFRRGRKSRGRKVKDVRNVGVTISIGVASRDSRKLGPEDVLKKADEALYRAKAAGRNKIIS